MIQASEAQLAAANRQDVAATAAFYTLDAVISLSNGSQIVGAPAIREALDGMFAAGRVSATWESQQLTPMGADHVYHRLVQTVQIGGGAPAREIVTLIWTRTPDGWKIASDAGISMPSVTPASP